MMNAEHEKLFWYWINERHRIYVHRTKGQPWPWTDDPILRKYKFTNVFRKLDRQTQYLLRGLRRVQNHDRLTLMRHCLVFRMFNWHETYETLAPLIDTWTYEAAHEQLTQHRNHGQIFTGAYIIPNQGLTTPKVELVLRALTMMLCDSVALLPELMHTNTIENAVRSFRRYSGVGGFIAYELACDLTYVPILRDATDRYTWANPGPGAKRGLNRLHDRWKGSPLKVDAANEEMRRLLARSARRTHKHVPPLEMRDIEHSLCEFDKYMRVLNNEGRPRSTFRQTKKT